MFAWHKLKDWFTWQGFSRLILEEKFDEFLKSLETHSKEIDQEVGEHTPLGLSCRLVRPQYIVLLLEHAADPNKLQYKLEKTVLGEVFEGPHKPTAKLLMLSGGKRGLRLPKPVRKKEAKDIKDFYQEMCKLSLELESLQDNYQQLAQFWQKQAEESTLLKADEFDQAQEAVYQLCYRMRAIKCYVQAIQEDNNPHNKLALLREVVLLCNEILSAPPVTDSIKLHTANYEVLPTLELYQLYYRPMLLDFTVQCIQFVEKLAVETEQQPLYKRLLKNAVNLSRALGNHQIADTYQPKLDQFALTTDGSPAYFSQQQMRQRTPSYIEEENEDDPTKGLLDQTRRYT